MKLPFFPIPPPSLAGNQSSELDAASGGGGNGEQREVLMRFLIHTPHLPGCGIPDGGDGSPAPGAQESPVVSSPGLYFHEKSPW